MTTMEIVHRPNWRDLYPKSRDILYQDPKSGAVRRGGPGRQVALTHVSDIKPNRYDHRPPGKR